MQTLTGVNKKIIAGLNGVILFLAFSIAQISVASEPADAPPIIQSQPATENMAAQNATSPASNTSPVNTPKVAVTKTDSASQLASVIGGLAIIIVLIYGLSWFVKRFAQGGFAQNPGMKIISSMPLGTRERLMLVDVGGKQLLLGVTATQINTLHVFDEPVITAEKAHHGASDFSQKLMAILQKNQNPDITADKKSNP